MLDNHKALTERAQLKSYKAIPGIPKEVVDSMSKRKLDAETPFAEKGPIQTTTDANDLIIEKPKANLMGPEFFEIITGRLKFDVNVKNVRIYYEDGQTLNLASGSGSKNFFSFCFNISELKLNTVYSLDLGRHLFQVRRLRQLQGPLQRRQPHEDLLPNLQTDLPQHTHPKSQSRGLPGSQPNPPDNDRR